MTRPELVKTLVAAMLSAAVAAPLRAADDGPQPGTRTPPRPPPVWELAIRTTEPVYADVHEVRLILTVRNVSDKTQQLSLPYEADQEWCQWIRVVRDGKALRRRPDEDYAIKPTSLAPRQQVSVLVGLDRFVDEPSIGKGAGRYTLTWPGTTIARAADATALFTVDTSRPAAAPAAAIDALIGRAAGTALSPAEQTRRLWTRLLATPSDPRWVAILPTLGRENIDARSSLKLAESSSDFGVRREAIRILAKIGPDATLAALVSDFLDKQTDEPLLEIGRSVVERLRSKS